jgi:glycosyltransferase involved in cell wall biosynthesis
MPKLAIVTSHPIQYYAPWFRYLAAEPDFDIKVFYLWDFGVTQQLDVGFQQSIQWDVPLLNGYEHEFVANISSQPGTHHFWGLQNPNLSQQVNAYKPDAVLLLNYNYASLYRFIFQWDSSQAPLLFRGDSHRLVPRSGMQEWARRQVITHLYRYFSALLYVGKANYNYFQHHGVSSRKLFFAPHAVDNDRFLTQLEEAKLAASAWKQRSGIPTNHRVILFAGKFEAKKRPKDLVQAFLQADLPQVSLLLVGAGPLESELRSQAAGQPNIFFAPFQNQTQMPRTYAAADLFVLPSFGPEETWGLAINEAMCMGCPIIVSTHVGCAQDLVHPDQNGLVFPAGDISALADRLQKALSDRKRLREWGEESHRIITRYSYEQTTQGLRDALASLNILKPRQISLSQLNKPSRC